jgi:6,7-dimethyl-8-ribityllumazine synthase
MQGADVGNVGDLAGDGLRIGIVRARFNDAVTTTLAEACLAELERLDVDESDIKHITVPGALEVPVALKALAASGEFDALIALGCVIRGETYHFELVANESGAGVSRVALDHQIPSPTRSSPSKTKLRPGSRAVEKGRDAARAAVEMANLMEDLA